MMNENTVVLSGNLTRDAEVRATKNGSEIANFSIAVNDRKKVGDEWEDYPNYIDCKLFNASGIAASLVKGAAVKLEGKLHQDRWEKDGKKSSKLLVHVDLIDVKKKGVYNAPTSMTGPEISLYDADIPF